jgi:hypothetical protein
VTVKNRLNCSNLEIILKLRIFITNDTSWDSLDRRRNSAVGVLVSLRARLPRNRSSISGRNKKLLRSIRVGCGANHATHSTGTMGFYPEGVKPTAHLHLVPRLRMGVLHCHSPTYLREAQWNKFLYLNLVGQRIGPTQGLYVHTQGTQKRGLLPHLVQLKTICALQLLDWRTPSHVNGSACPRPAGI